MFLTIDNNDGAGGVDYTPALLRARPLTITRRRGEWTRCRGGLDVLGAGLPWPAAMARVTVTNDVGAVLFQGFASGVALSTAEGAAAGGDEDLPVFEAMEAAWLTAASPNDALLPAGAAVRTLQMQDVTLSLGAAAVTQSDALATDVTLTGENEAAAYVTELFRGDGTTTDFALAHAPFRETGSETLLADSFDDAVLNAAEWTKVDPLGDLTLGSGGLHMSGGSGVDGATVLKFAQPVEMGGTLVAEATGLQLTAGSGGLLLGFYNGAVGLSTCVAGVFVDGTGGAHSLAAVVNGVVQTSTYALTAGHSYTVRLRLHCAELQRVLGTYEALVDGALQTFGGGTVAAPLHVVLEVVDLGLASSTLPTVLFDGAISSSPAQCLFAPINSTALVGSVAGLSLVQGGSAWVVSTATDGSVTTRREGAAGTGADYSMSSTGRLTFAAGLVPQPGELLTVTYRRSRRAVARLKDAAADELRLVLGLPGLPQWTGHVLRPAARSSADCAAAASALLALADGAATNQAGSVEWTGGAALSADVNPADTLVLDSAGGAVTLPVQSVTVTDGNCLPELLRYKAEFAQGRADSLSFTVAKNAAADLPLPVVVTAAVGALPASLSGLQVTSATATALEVDGGADPVTGGGFEVRRSDANFGSSSAGDLVLQSPVRAFSIPRVAFAERFFVRMYDASVPVMYSAVSSLVLTSLPTS